MIALLLRFWWAPVIALALTLAGVQTARLNHAKGDLVKAKASIAALTSAKASSETARAVEATAATNSFNALQSACAAGLAASVAKGRVIERFINAPAKPDGSRAMCDASCLRALLGQTGSDGNADALHK